MSGWTCEICGSWYPDADNMYLNVPFLTPEQPTVACKDCNMAHRAKHPEETQKMEDWVAEYRKTHG